MSLATRVMRKAVVWTGWAGLWIALYGIGLFTGQVYLWLRSGVWAALPATYILVRPEIAILRASQTDPPVEVYPVLQQLAQYIPSFATPTTEAWVLAPSSWIGLQRLVVGFLDLLSIPACAVLLGGLLGVWAMGKVEHLDQANVRAKEP